MRKTGFMLAAVFAASTAVAAQQAQTPPPAAQQPRPPVPLETTLQNQHRTIRANLAKGAAMMPEADYTFQTTPATRQFGKLIAHIALANFGQCAGMLGQPNPMQGRRLEDEQKTKAEAVQWLDDSLALCDQAYANITAANVLTMVKVGQSEVTMAGRAVANLTHNNESYGTMVVYLRLKGLTPPSSEGR